MSSELNKGEAFRSAIRSLRHLDVSDLAEFAKSTADAVLGSGKSKVANKELSLVLVATSSGAFLLSLLVVHLFFFLLIIGAFSLLGWCSLLRSRLLIF